VPFVNLACFVRQTRLWAGSRQATVECTRTIMTTSSSELAPMPKLSSSSSASDSNGIDSLTPSAKKLHGRTFYESIGSPKFVLAPMVDQSEFVSPLPKAIPTYRAQLTSDTGMAYANPIFHVARLEQKPRSLYTYDACSHVWRDHKVPG